MKTKRDYTGRTVFVGIDVHKKTYSIVVLCEGAIVKRDTITALPSNLSKYLTKFFVGAKIFTAYEAGFSGYSLHRHLESKGIKNIVVHAASIEIGARDRVKTDKRDSLKIATQLAAGRLRGIYIPSKEMEDRRELTRYRADLINSRKRIGSKLKQKANYYGLVGPSDTQKVCLKWIKDQLAKPMGHYTKIVFTKLARTWETLTNEIKEIDSLLQEQATNDERLEIVFRSAKGVGPTAARILANELGDMSQFPSERALSSYTGLTPCEYSSGEHIRRGHISRQGKPMLRCILVQCAWVAIKYDESLRIVYERLSHRAGVKRAIVAVARRLIIRLRACFQTGTLYRSNKLPEVVA